MAGSSHLELLHVRTLLLDPVIRPCNQRPKQSMNPVTNSYVNIGEISQEMLRHMKYCECQET